MGAARVGQGVGAARVSRLVGRVGMVGQMGAGSIVRMLSGVVRRMRGVVRGIIMGVVRGVVRGVGRSVYCVISRFSSMLKVAMIHVLRGTVEQVVETPSVVVVVVPAFPG